MPKLPDRHGHFGPYGGRYVSETLMPALAELERAYNRLRREARFRRDLRALQRDYAGRPTPFYHAARLSRALGGARIYLKREDLCHTGAHKINNTLGQILLARRMGKSRIIAETGAGQHGVATATVAALFGLRCEVYMGSEDIRRQSLNAFRMRLLGAAVHPVDSGSRTLKDALNEALRDWITNVRDTFYIIGSVTGPHPYPMIVRDFQTVIGVETRRQARQVLGRLPDYLVACVGGGSNAIGLFHPFLKDRSVKMIGVEAAGRGLASGAHAAPLAAGQVGVLHGQKSYLLQNEAGQIRIAHSISAGLDYPGVGPEHSYLRDSGRVRYEAVEDDEAVRALRTLAEHEGIIPALESAHAVAAAIRLAPTLPRRATVVVNLSGRGDKDMETVADYLGIAVRGSPRLDEEMHEKTRPRASERPAVPKERAGS
jgi:tryptophan synthase beta chain